MRTRLRSRNSKRFVSQAKYSPNVSLAANDLPTVVRRASGFLFVSSECALEKSQTVTPLPSLRISADRTKEGSLFKEPMCSGHRPQRFLRRSECIAVSASEMSEPSCVTRWASKYTKSLGLPLSVLDVKQRHSRSCCPAIPRYIHKHDDAAQRSVASASWTGQRLHFHCTCYTCPWTFTLLLSDNLISSRPRVKSMLSAMIDSLTPDGLVEDND